MTDRGDRHLKQRTDAPSGFFAVEAAGLRWLAAATDSGGVHVVDPVDVRRDRIVLPRLRPGRPGATAARVFGRALAVTHDSGAPAHGSPPAHWSGDGFIGDAPLPHGGRPTWGRFYAELRVAPYLRTARDAGAIGPADAAVLDRLCEVVVDDDPRFTGPPEPPSRLHGDLWSGNVMWGAGPAGEVVLIDPAAHGGHRETDLAMLSLFGLPHLDDVLAGYDEQHPLADGWRERVALHQVHPLLVHTVLFGGSYGSAAGRAATSALRQ